VRPVFDLAAVRRTLQHGIDRGYWTLEQLDRHPKGHLRPEAYRNLLRDEPLEPRVEVTAPRDFVPPPAAPAEEDWI
jgi:hypothetical protein